MITVLFACVQNAGRSQMAAGLFYALVDPAAARAISAGTRPAVHVHPEVVEAMRDVGVELGNQRPTLLTEGVAASAEVLVTMGCGESCPFVSGVERVEWNISDPNGQSMERVRSIRDEIRRHVEQLIASRGWPRREN